MSFNNLQLISPLLQALGNNGYSSPTPIQKQAIPVILKEKDLLGCAQTGTGKTAAFALPLLQLMHLRNDTSKNQRRFIKTLILTPTRELAIQTGENFGKYGKYLDLEHLVIFGGVPQFSQVATLRRGVDILIATPGRLLDLMNQKHISLRDIKFFVLDEADRMLDMGFVHDVKRVIAKLPAQRQTLFFSATMPPPIQELSGILLKNPVKIEVNPESPTAETIQQELYHTERQNKRPLLIHLLEDVTIQSALVFTKTKHGADKLSKDLKKAGIRSEAIHGNKSQIARQIALRDFKNGKTRVLVATDIAARGIDIDKLSHVINYDLPDVSETYVHRIGRTGRAGAFGKAISFCSYEERQNLRDIQKLISKTIPCISGHPFDTTLAFDGVRPPAQRSHQRKKVMTGKRYGRVFLQRA